jgi:hypothetical protein
MTSKPLENEFETACKNCLFAVYDENTQVGCTLGRIKKWQDQFKVIDAYDEDKEFYVIKGVCNTVREPGWNNNVADEAKVRAEVRPKFDVILDVENISEEWSEELIQFYKDVSETDFDVNWIIMADKSISRESRKIVAELLRNTDSCLVEYVDLEYTICETMLKSRRAFTVLVDQLSVLDPNMFNRVDILLNEDLRKFVYYVCEGTPAFSNLAFHIYQKKMDTMNGYDVLEKIYEESIELKLNIMEVSNAEEQYYNYNDKEA